MRILFAAAPGVGHLMPFVPTAWAALLAGHDVLVASTGPSLDMAIRSGLAAFDVSDGGATDAYYRAGAAAIADGRPYDTADQWSMFSALFTREDNLDGSGVTTLAAEVNDRMMDGTLRVAREWDADIIVYTPFLSMAVLVANAVGIPAVLHGIGLPFPSFSAVLALMSEARERNQIRLPPTGPAASIDVCPPSLRPSSAPRGWPVRYVPYNGGGSLPDWVPVANGRPRICLTLGSVLPRLGATEVLECVLDAVSSVDVEVVVAGGKLSGLARSTRVRSQDWLPLNALLPTCALIVHHGGSGSTFTALALGVPQLVLPQIADQPVNAEAVVRRGVGVALPAPDADASSVRKCLHRILADQSMRDAAANVQKEMAALPGPEDTIRRLISLVSAAERKTR